MLLVRPSRSNAAICACSSRTPSLSAGIGQAAQATTQPMSLYRHRSACTGYHTHHIQPNKQRKTKQLLNTGRAAIIIQSHPPLDSFCPCPPWIHHMWIHCPSIDPGSSIDSTTYPCYTLHKEAHLSIYPTAIVSHLQQNISHKNWACKYKNKHVLKLAK